MKNMKKTVITCFVLVSLSANAAFANTVTKVEESLTVHQWAHFGAGYIINDQLRKNTKMTPLERVLTTAFIGYAKEKWVDKEFNNKEFLSTAAGALFVEVKF